MNPVVVEYKIIDGESATYLGQMLAIWISQGWQPFGGLSTAITTRTKESGTGTEIYMYYAQAIVRYQ